MPSHSVKPARRRYLPICLLSAVLAACWLYLLLPSRLHPVAPVAEPAPEPPDGAIDDAWELLLVNPWHALPEDYTVTLAELDSNHSVDARILEPLTQMLDNMRAAGLSPLVCSAYRTQAFQQELYDAKVAACLRDGLSQPAAEAEAAQWVAVPGTSEHQTGLAVDIVSLDQQVLDERQEDTPEQQWLMAHAHEYGFTLRYPTGDSGTTGFAYEPWHYRYVGDYAPEIYRSGLCLEAWLAEQE